MTLSNTLQSLAANIRLRGIEGTATAALARHIEEHNPPIRLKQARRAPREEPSFSLVDRGGVAYYVKPSYKVLNPYAGWGTGLQFVKGSNADPTGIYLTRTPDATDEERMAAVKAYLLCIGVPRANLVVLPATCWPRTYDRTPENVAAPRNAGTLLLPHEGA